MNFQRIKYYLGWFLFFEGLIIFILMETITARMNFLQFGVQYQQVLQNAANVIDNLSKRVDALERERVKLEPQEKKAN